MSPRKKIKKRWNLRAFFKSLLLVLFSAGLLALSFSGFHLEFLAWIGLIPLLFALEGKSAGQRILLCFFFALFFFLGTVYCLIYVSQLGLSALCLYLAAEFSLIGIFLKHPRTNHSLILIPAVWILFEKFRGWIFSGFGWGWLAYTQYKQLLLIQSADKFGALGISFLIVLVNVSLFQLITRRFRVRWYSPCVLLPVLLLSADVVYGVFALQRNYKSPDLSVSVVQGNIPQEQKWDPLFASDIMSKYSRLTQEAAQQKPDLIVWPETAVPGYLMDEPNLYKQIVLLAEHCRTNLLVGSPRENYRLQKYYNSAFLFSGQGYLRQFHDKIHLVPFGEYIPDKKIFWFLEDPRIADFSAGKKYTLFTIRDKTGRPIHFAVLICFEDVFPGIVKKYRREGADFFLTITNEAWFKISEEPRQHMAQSVFRSVENRCWSIRAANTGISGFISPKGRIAGEVEKGGRNIFVSGIKTVNLKDSE